MSLLDFCDTQCIKSHCHMLWYCVEYHVFMSLALQSNYLVGCSSSSTCALALTESGIG
jgi:hypothetical protein